MRIAAGPDVEQDKCQAGSEELLAGEGAERQKRSGGEQDQPGIIGLAVLVGLILENPAVTHGEEDVQETVDVKLAKIEEARSKPPHLALDKDLARTEPQLELGHEPDVLSDAKGERRAQPGAGDGRDASEFHGGTVGDGQEATHTDSPTDTSAARSGSERKQTGGGEPRRGLIVGRWWGLITGQRGTRGAGAGAFPLQRNTGIGATGRGGWRWAECLLSR